MHKALIMSYPTLYASLNIYVAHALQAVLAWFLSSSSQPVMTGAGTAHFSGRQ